MNEGEPEGGEDKRSCPPIGPCQDPNLRHAHNAARSIRTAQASVCLSLGVYYRVENAYEFIVVEKVTRGRGSAGRRKLLSLLGNSNTLGLKVCVQIQASWLFSLYLATVEERRVCSSIVERDGGGGEGGLGLLPGNYLASQRATENPLCCKAPSPYSLCLSTFHSAEV
ncbi:hypothetical protein KQX54_004956 [Cotesia glomerata]|uniref:Uncharacterized protein n=1 Tax=Cotesia glomerata TaxID=32391 RepID=A0AAV7ICI4_COTGL|nr:hypothetical protein KQX54_004956 [Cotesia glomerata]